MYRTTKIFELPEELSAGPNQYLPIDVPDVGSPTGWTTKRILTREVSGSINQDLETTLQVGSVTGTNRLQISDPLNPLTFLDTANLTKLDLVQPTMLADLVINLPSTSGTLALAGAGGTSLATSDQAINQTGARIITLGGSLGTDKLQTKTLGGTTVTEVKGDNTLTVPTGYLGVGTNNVGGGFGGHKLTVVNGTSSSGVYVQQGGANGKAVDILMSASSASSYGLYVTSRNSGPIQKYGIRVDITGANGSAKNRAIYVENGLIISPNMPTSSAGLPPGTFWNNGGVINIK